MTAPEDVLSFWFGARDRWFRKSAQTDALIRTRFGADVQAALAGALDHWADSPRGALALVLLLDQFTRNVYRDTPRAFAGDAQALALARRLVERGDDRRLGPYERWFAYMPFEHAESIEAQRESVRLFEALAEETGLAEPLVWARRHHEVIARFGRFPHRNPILGRASSAEELEFLQQPGSRF